MNNVYCRSEESSDMTRNADSSPKPVAKSTASKPTSLTTTSSSPAAERKPLTKPDSLPSRDDLLRPSLAR